MTAVLIRVIRGRSDRQERRMYQETQGRRPREDGGRDWKYAATSKGALKDSDSH